MTDSPSRDAARHIAAFGRQVAGTLRPATVAQSLTDTLHAVFPRGTVSLGLLEGDTGGLTIFHTDGPDPEPLLELALARGPLLVIDNLASKLQAEGLRLAVDTPECWIGVPLVSRVRSVGSACVGGPAGRFGPDDLALLEALASVAAVALEGARLAGIRDDGRQPWEEMVNAVTLALCLVDARGRVRRANRAFAGLTQVPLEMVAGEPWQKLVPAAWAREIQAALDAAGSGREVPLRADTRILGVTAYPVGDPVRRETVLLFDDQTERRRLQEQLIQSEKMSAIGQLIAGVAHDLNNPLASVVGFADFLLEARNVPSHLGEPLRVIQQEAERAASIVKSLLGFARKQEHGRRATPLAPLLEATLGLLRNQLASAQVEITLEVEPDVPAPEVDPNQIQQVFVNLINNAAQAITATGRAGWIEVRVRRWMDGVAVDVIDDGPGMTDATAARVFDPFFTTKAEGQGTGLGLTICQGIVKEHGGRIVLRTADGAGAVFTVELPAPQEAPTTDAPGEAPRVVPSGLRVLVVDDEPHILHYMRATLEAWGHTVEVASDGATALALVDGLPLDLIISDLRMPRVSGAEFYEELLERHPELARRTVFSTGDTIRGDTTAFLERHGRPCLQKPFSLAELRALLARIPREGPSADLTTT